MKIFLDDDDELRPTPSNWFRVYNVSQLIHMVLSHQSEVEEISLDNDLGKLAPLLFDEREVVHEGFQFVNWLEEKFHSSGNDFLTNLKSINIHSANSVRRDGMLRGMAAINKHLATFSDRQIEVTVIEFQNL